MNFTGSDNYLINCLGYVLNKIPDRGGHQGYMPGGILNIRLLIVNLLAVFYSVPLPLFFIIHSLETAGRTTPASGSQGKFVFPFWRLAAISDMLPVFTGCSLPPVKLFSTIRTFFHFLL